MPDDYRFSESRFRRFEPILKNYQDVFPRSLEVDPMPWSVETVSCRIRDCVRAFQVSSWESVLDKQKFFPIWDKTQVIRQEKTVILRPKVFLNIPMVHELPPQIPAKELLENAPQSVTGKYKHAELPAIVVDRPTLNVVTSLLVLHDSGTIQQPSKLTNCSGEVVQFVKNNRDFDNIGVVYQDNDTTIIIA